MDAFDRAALRAELSRDEGRRRKPYVDTRGFLTVGVGWNLDANGLPEEIIDRLLDIGIDHARDVLDALEPRWVKLDEVRRRVLLNMAFNLGPLKLSQFRRFWVAVREALEFPMHTESMTRDACFEDAAREMLDSLWADQVGKRAKRLAAEMRTGVQSQP